MVLGDPKGKSTLDAEETATPSGIQPVDDGVVRLVPADPLELSGSRDADPTQGVGQAVL
jgi:hypothetical protein